MNRPLLAGQKSLQLFSTEGTAWKDTHIHSLDTLPYLQLGKKLLHARSDLLVRRHRAMDFYQKLVQLLGTVESRGEAAHKRDRPMALGRLVQEEHVILYGLTKDPQSSVHVGRVGDGGKLPTCDEIVECLAVGGESEHGGITLRQIRAEEEAVELVDSTFTSRGAAVHCGAMLLDECASVGDSVCVVLIHNDQVGRAVGLDAFSRVSRVHWRKKCMVIQRNDDEYLPMVMLYFDL